MEHSGFSVMKAGSHKMRAFLLTVLMFTTMIKTSCQIVVDRIDTSELAERQKRATLSTVITTWPQGKIPYMIDASVGSDLKVPESITLLEDVSCIDFIDANTNDVNTLGLGHTRVLYFTDKNSESQCYSDLGKTGDSGNQELVLDAGCVSGLTRTPTHEILHALGFRHEFKRSDRDSYLTINNDNIDPSFASNFDISTTVDKSKRFDLSTVMQYSGDLFRISSDSGPTMEPLAKIYLRVGRPRDNLGGFGRGDNNALSHRDKASINSVYECAASCSPPLECQNGGYLSSDCTCQCPFAFTGNLCQDLDTSSNSGDCSGPEITASSGTITPPQLSGGFKFDLECVWRIKGSNEADRVRVRITSMTVVSDNTGAGMTSKPGGSCPLTEQLYIYLYGTDSEFFPISCDTDDINTYLNEWSESDTNTVILHWKSEGTHNTGGPPPMPVQFADNTGWTLEYEIVSMGGDTNTEPTDTQTTVADDTGGNTEGTTNSDTGDDTTNPDAQPTVAGPELSFT